MNRRGELDPENETGGFCNGAVHVKWFLFATAQRAERLKIAFQAVDPPLAELRRFEHFGSAKYLSLLKPTPEGRHYSVVGD